MRFRPGVLIASSILLAIVAVVVLSRGYLVSDQNVYFPPGSVEYASFTVSSPGRYLIRVPFTHAVVTDANGHVMQFSPHSSVRFPSYSIVFSRSRRTLVVLRASELYGHDVIAIGLVDDPGDLSVFPHLVRPSDFRPYNNGAVVDLNDTLGHIRRTTLYYDLPRNDGRLFFYSEFKLVPAPNTYDVAFYRFQTDGSHAVGAEYFRGTVRLYYHEYTVRRMGSAPLESDYAPVVTGYLSPGVYNWGYGNRFMGYGSKVVFFGSTHGSINKIVVAEQPTSSSRGSAQIDMYFKPIYYGHVAPVDVRCGLSGTSAVVLCNVRFKEGYTPSPDDLVVFDLPIDHHVAVYVLDGFVFDAPRPGKYYIFNDSAPVGQFSTESGLPEINVTSIGHFGLRDVNVSIVDFANGVYSVPGDVCLVSSSEDPQGFGSRTAVQSCDRVVVADDNYIYEYGRQLDRAFDHHPPVMVYSAYVRSFDTIPKQVGYITKTADFNNYTGTPLRVVAQGLSVPGGGCAYNDIHVTAMDSRYPLKSTSIQCYLQYRERIFMGTGGVDVPNILVCSGDPYRIVCVDTRKNYAPLFVEGNVVSGSAVVLAGSGSSSVDVVPEGGGSAALSSPSSSVTVRKVVHRTYVAPVSTGGASGSALSVVPATASVFGLIMIGLLAFLVLMG